MQKFEPIYGTETDIEGLSFANGLDDLSCFAVLWRARRQFVQAPMPYFIARITNSWILAPETSPLIVSEENSPGPLRALFLVEIFRQGIRQAGTSLPVS